MVFQSNNNSTASSGTHWPYRFSGNERPCARPSLLDVVGGVEKKPLITGAYRHGPAPGARVAQNAPWSPCVDHGGVEAWPRQLPLATCVSSNMRSSYSLTVISFECKDGGSRSNERDVSGAMTSRPATGPPRRTSLSGFLAGERPCGRQVHVR